MVKDLSRGKITEGWRLPALRAVLASDVPPGSQIWGFQEPDTRHLVLFPKPHLCRRGTRPDPEQRPGLVSLGPGFDGTDDTALMLIQETP